MALRLDANYCPRSCEREGKWLDEAVYAVDISILPRGGSRRRKSMEPRALLNMNGNLSKATGLGRRNFSAEMTQKFKAELVSTPVRDRTFDQGFEAAGQTQEHSIKAEIESAGSIDSDFSTPTGVFAIGTASATLAPATPTGFVNYDPSTSQTPGGGPADGADSSTTPCHPSQGAKLVQMTCPPKQTGRGLFEEEKGEHDGIGFGVGVSGFPISGRLGDVKDEAVRKRLAEARRRTTGWRPRVGSPLGR